MGKTYQCPDCGGTEIVWDRGLGKTVCPKDRAPVDSYKIANLERSTTIKKKTAESKKTTQKKTEKGKTTTKKTKRKKKSS